MVSVTDGEAGFNPRGSRVTTDFADRLGSSVLNVRDCLFYFLPASGAQNKQKLQTGHAVLPEPKKLFPLPEDHCRSP